MLKRRRQEGNNNNNNKRIIRCLKGQSNYLTLLQNCSQQPPTAFTAECWPLLSPPSLFSSSDLLIPLTPQPQSSSDLLIPLSPQSAPALPHYQMTPSHPFCLSLRHLPDTQDHTRSLAPQPPASPLGRLITLLQGLPACCEDMRAETIPLLLFGPHRLGLSLAQSGPPTYLLMNLFVHYWISNHNHLYRIGDCRLLWKTGEGRTR